MLKTYSREELKQLEGKRVRATRQTKKSIVAYAGILWIGNADTFADTLEVGDVTIYRHLIPDYQFELLENEFEVGEEVEVRDEEDGIRQPRIYLCTVPWNTRYPHIVVDCRFIEEYSKGKIFLNEDFRYIRKIQPKPEPKKMTMEELNKELWYEVEIVEKK